MNRDAMARLEEAYVDALAAQIAGEGDSEEWATFREVLERAMLLSVLLGASDVVSQAKSGGAEVEIENMQFSRYQAPLVTAPFEESIEAFLNRIPELRNVVDTMTPDLRAQAFWVTGVEKREALGRIQRQLGKQLEEIKAEQGFGVRPFIEFFEDSGFANLTAARLETVYRTNTLSAFNAGRFQQMSSPGLASQTAVWRLNEIRDRRTRGNPAGLYPFPKFGPHFQMDGFMAPVSDPIWTIIWPPNGFNCRANVSPITWATAQRMGLATEGRLRLDVLEQRTGAQRAFVESGQYPDEGFRTGPGMRAA